MESFPRPLIVACAGGHASELAAFIRDFQVAGEPVHVRGFVDDHRFESMFEGAPLLGRVDQLGAYLNAHHDEQFLYIVAVGDTRTRSAIVRRVQALGASNLIPWTARHATAVVGDTVRIGAGSHVGPGAVITARVTIGEHCMINANASIAHHVEIAAFANVNQGASICGGVMIGEGCFVGAGATIADGVQLGAWSVIGAGAVVIDNIPAHVTVEGVPARIVQRHGRGMRQATLTG